MVVNLANFLSVNFEKGVSLYQLSRKNKVGVMYVLFFIEESNVVFCNTQTHENKQQL